MSSTSSGDPSNHSQRMRISSLFFAQGRDAVGSDRLSLYLSIFRVDYTHDFLSKYSKNFIFDLNEHILGLHSNSRIRIPYLPPL